MSKISTGSDVEAQCSKCGESRHVILAKVGERIAKVQCKRCGGQHRYKPPEGQSAVDAVARSVRAPAPARIRAAGAAPRKRGAAVAVPVGPRVVPDPSRPVRPYRLDQTYTTRDRIQHVKFGLGIVEGSPGPGKITVYFAEGRKILAQAEPPSMSITRPVEALREES
jgi:hypothetical protein